MRCSCSTRQPREADGPPLPKVNHRRNPERNHRRNPENPWREAVDKYTAFHWGDEPRRVKRREVSPAPKTAFEIGTLHAVVYETVKDGEKATWEHEFGETGKKKPRLVADIENHRLHIVGGEYDVRPEGIVD